MQKARGGAEGNRSYRAVYYVKDKLFRHLSDENVEVTPLSVYSVERQRGVSFLEPAREKAPSTEEGDKRFEEYFLTGRKGEVRSAGA